MIKELQGITQPKNNTTLWRYMSFEKFADILATETLFFARADQYDDKFEGYIPESAKLPHKPDINPAIDRVNSSFRPYIMCNCWHKREEESMAMWDKYHLRNNGIAIKTTMRNLKNSLSDKPNIFIGKIQYINNHNEIDMPVDVDNFLYYPYFYKRKPFEYEHEVRAIIDIASIPRDVSYEFGTPLEINVQTLIGENGEVIVSPHADRWVAGTLELIVKRCGFEFPVNRSRLLDPPV